MKKIYIDGLGLVEGHFSGIGQYILGILKGMDELLDNAKYAGKDTPEIKVIIPFDTVKRFNEFEFKHVSYKIFPLSLRYMTALWHRNWLPPIDLICGQGLYIFPRFADMRLAFSPSAALVIYDLSFELYRQYSDEGNARFLSKAVKRSIKKTKKVIVISENVKKEVIDYYGLPSKDIVVATPATDPRLFYRRSHGEIEKVKQKYAIKGSYILALSNLEPRKNLDSLIEAYCHLPKNVTKDLSLLLVGVDGWKMDKLYKKIVEKVTAGYKIIRPICYVSDIDKPAIISGAKMLIYPSHYEGFGMPPLEALACGTPVITANNSSLPEVVGQAAKLINSDDISELSLSIREYLTDIKSITNKSIKNGPAQARRFSWITSAENILNSLEDNT